MKDLSFSKKGYLVGGNNVKEIETEANTYDLEFTVKGCSVRGP